MAVDYRKLKAIEKKNKERILVTNHRVNEGSGIYFLTREDEDGFKYAYIGQAKHLLTRLAQHLSGYQHIDLSLKKHGLYSEKNSNGWTINFENCPIDKLDEMEQIFIKYYAEKGYQLRNKTSGSQGEGKKKIDDYRPTKGYYDGIKQGKKSLAKELSAIIDKHLEIALKESKKNNKVSQKMFEKFKELLLEDTYND